MVQIDMNGYAIIFASGTIIPISLFALFFGFIYAETGSTTENFPYTKVLMMVPEKTNYYAYAFKTCSGQSILKEPTILVSSDLEYRTINLIKDIPASSCFITGALIKALDPNTVSFTVYSNDKQIDSSTDLKQKDTQLRTELLQKSQEISKLLSNPEQKDFDKKFVKLTEDIRSLREKLGLAKSTFK